MVEGIRLKVLDLRTSGVAVSGSGVSRDFEFSGLMFVVIKGDGRSTSCSK